MHIEYNGSIAVVRLRTCGNDQATGAPVSLVQNGYGSPGSVLAVSRRETHIGKRLLSETDIHTPPHPGHRSNKNIIFVEICMVKLTS
jgi:hypothetical protein